MHETNTFWEAQHSDFCKHPLFKPTLKTLEIWCLDLRDMRFVVKVITQK